jgi:DNA-binding transcriptional ArsR family regulator
MDRLANLEIPLQALREAIGRADIGAVERLSDLVRTQVLETVIAGERDWIEKMRDRLIAFRAVATRALDRSNPEHAAIAMLVRSDAALAALAARIRPTAVQRTDAADGRGRVRRPLRARIGRRLSEAHAGVSTSELARTCDAAVESVSRELAKLKAEGLVTSHRMGKHSMSRLTLRGREAFGTGSRGRRSQQILSGLRPTLREPALLGNRIDPTGLQAVGDAILQGWDGNLAPRQASAAVGEPGLARLDELPLDRLDMLAPTPVAA